MARTTGNLDAIFDRSWRPGHPFRPRLSPLRRWAMSLLLVFLLTIITAYVYITDSNRVQRMCQSYLSNLCGGEVTIKHAALSIFEGLRLDGVTVRVDKSGAFDSTIFDAQTLLIKYDPALIIQGKLEASEIVAIDPRVQLCENMDTRSWNYQRLVLPTQPTSKPGPRKLPPLPLIQLRNAMIDYSQVQNGQVSSLGSMSLDGGLQPESGMGRYSFILQSRGISGGLGPSVSGDFNFLTGDVNAGLDNFVFGRDINAMLPDEIRRFMEEHKLAGKVKIPDFHLRPREGKTPAFRVETELDHVVMSVNPNEWLGSAVSDRLSTLHGAFDLLRAGGFNDQLPGHLHAGGKSSAMLGFVDRLESCVTPLPVQLYISHGVFLFTQDGVKVTDVIGTVENNTFVMNGQIDGYSPSAPAEITIDGREIQIPENPQYVNSLPREVRELYEHMHPSGRGSLWVHVVRPQHGGKPEFSGTLKVEEGKVKLDQFPYPLRGISGEVTFGPDPVNGTRLDIDLAAKGALNGPNEDKSLYINGWIAPLGPEGEFFIRATADDISSEPRVRESLPAEAREALDHVDPSHTGLFPMFRGDLTVDLTRVPGPDKPMYAFVTLDFHDGKGAYDLFPYMLDQVSGKLIVGPGFVKIQNAVGRHGAASLGIDGEFTFARNKPLVPKIRLTGRDMKIDRDLLAALQPDQRQWIERLGIGGTVDVNGLVFRTLPAGGAGPTTAPIGTTQPAVPDIELTLDIALRDGSLAPRGTTFTLKDVNGKVRSADHQLVLTDFKAKRDDATVTGDGVIGLGGDEPQLSLHTSAINLKLDPQLYSLIPSDGQAAWDLVDPHGTADVDFRYHSATPATHPTTNPTTMPSIATQQAAHPSTAPSGEAGFELTLQPRKLSATFRDVPYRLDNVAGTILVKNDSVTLKQLTARHGAAEIALRGGGGSGGNSGRSKWELNLSGRNLPADDDLRRALPPALTHLLDSTSLTGKFSFDFPKLVYTGPESPAGAATAASTSPVNAKSKPAQADGDIDLAGNLWMIDAALDVGVPLSQVQGMAPLDAHIRNGHLAGFKGAVDATSLTIAERPAANFHADLFKPADQDAMHISNMRCLLAGGEMAGQVDVAFPQTGPSRFGMSMVLRNADVKVLAGEKENIKGQLTASLALEGSWGDITTRRGRGDVKVAGRDMYQIPLVLGLLQVTNLALPISSPFSEANAGYSVDGQKVTFENLEMRASNMVMQGSGSLDFGTKQVRMTFVTDNPNWPKLPFVNDLIQGAKHELLQIQVYGTVQEPKVKGKMLNTFSTTVDEVFRGSGAAADRQK